MKRVSFAPISVAISLPNSLAKELTESRKINKEEISEAKRIEKARLEKKAVDISKRRNVCIYCENEFNSWYWDLECRCIDSICPACYILMGKCASKYCEGTRQTAGDFWEKAIFALVKESGYSVIGGFSNDIQFSYNKNTKYLIGKTDIKQMDPKKETPFVKYKIEGQTAFFRVIIQAKNE